MKVNDYLSRQILLLKDAGVPTARLDCLVLLEDVLNTNRTQLLAYSEREITEVERRKLDSMIAKRAQHVPLAYIRGKTEFYGREFIVNNHVLEPRPESETMIDMLKQRVTHDTRLIVDIGTGSGALAITAALELPSCEVIATDIDQRCITIAKKNAHEHATNVAFYQGDLLEALPGSKTEQPATLLCNLPYVPDNFQINTAATHEPHHAIFGGADGLELYRTLFSQLTERFPGKTEVFCESLPPQHEPLVNIAKSAGFVQHAEQDFIQLFVRG